MEEESEEEIWGSDSLPDPVSAIPTTSLPDKAIGIAWRWMGVGSL